MDDFQMVVLLIPLLWFDIMLYLTYARLEKISATDKERP